jgi:carboxypeptidase D
MTFGGAQGFTRKPSTPWYDDDGQFAGIIHQERSVLYALFDGSGHFVPAQKPKAVSPAPHFVRSIK